LSPFSNEAEQRLGRNQSPLMLVIVNSNIITWRTTGRAPPRTLPTPPEGAVLLSETTCAPQTWARQRPPRSRDFGQRQAVETRALRRFSTGGETAVRRTMTRKKKTMKMVLLLLLMHLLLLLYWLLILRMPPQQSRALVEPIEATNSGQPWSRTTCRRARLPRFCRSPRPG
jgi:hypothetical protein